MKKKENENPDRLQNFARVVRGMSNVMTANTPIRRVERFVREYGRARLTAHGGIYFLTADGTIRPANNQLRVQDLKTLLRLAKAALKGT